MESKTAILVIDMINEYVDPGGKFFCHCLLPIAYCLVLTFDL